MKVTLEIRASRGKQYYTVYNDTDYRLSNVIGSGWAIADAVGQFVEEHNRLSFYDDETPAYLKREDIELKRVMLFR